jgi:OOP family OmpA-OmpF porin
LRITSIAPVIFLFLCGALSLSACSRESPQTDLSAGDIADVTARFSVEYQRGHLRLSGHVASADHEQQLVELTAQRFVDAKHSITLSQLDSVPAYWQDTTVRLVDALAATHSASAILTNEMLGVRGIALAGWSNRLLLLQASLPESLLLAIDVVESDSQISVADLCARAMTQFQNGPINFEESGTAFRSSALPELERAVALANTCRDSSIEITGHTDSSGDESLNQQLSLARAQAVADYLAQRGIVATRLNPVGVGSSLPIADNRTRYGRGLNRRIDIRFLADDKTALEP